MANEPIYAQIIENYEKIIDDLIHQRADPEDCAKREKRLGDQYTEFCDEMYRLEITFQDEYDAIVHPKPDRYHDSGFLG